MEASSQSTYDEIPYGNFAFAATHPGRLATVTIMAGLTPVPVERCRVLELGCASGGNLIPMAEEFPDSKFYGIDASPRQVKEGQETIEKLQLPNIELRTGDIMEVGPDAGKFDYILCHGVFSWVPKHVQEKILEICRENLTPDGLAYISYNTYPGWHLRGMLRDMLKFRVRSISDTQECVKAGRDYLRFIKESFPEAKSVYAQILRLEVDKLIDEPDYYFFHEYLEADNHPCYFYEFVERASKHGLQYVDEARVNALANRIVQRGQDEIAKMAKDRLELEQYRDFLVAGIFRSSVLCHKEKIVDLSHQLDTLCHLYLTSDVRPVSANPELTNDKPEEFHNPEKESVTSKHPALKLALYLLSKRAPGFYGYGELWQEIVEKLPDSMRQSETELKEVESSLRGALLGFSKIGLVEISCLPNRLQLEISERPSVSRYARLQVLRGDRGIINRRHRRVDLEPFDNILVPLLDGTRDHQTLVQELAKMAEDDVFLVEHKGKRVKDRELLCEVLDVWVQASLRRLAGLAVLTG